MSDFLETIHFSSAADFLEYLQPRRSHWLPTNETSIPWVFRGQCNSEWSLSPSAMRTAWFDNFKINERDRLKKFIEEETSLHEYFAPERNQIDPNLFLEMVLQVSAERWAVEEFVLLADQVGHLVPEDKRLSAIGYEEFDLKSIAQELLQAVGYGSPFIPASVEYSLAQHHGIPTRALDWSHSPFVAAFFAAEEAFKPENKCGSKLAIWAMNYPDIKNTDLVIINQRKSKISYLQAQAGLFIYDKTANYFYLKTGEWRTFEQVLQSAETPFTHPVLRKLILPIEEKYELLRLLAAENITRAHIMPSFDNIIETLKINRILKISRIGIVDDQ